MQRMTRQRTAIIEVFRAAGRPLAPAEIAPLIAGDSGEAPSLSTVYRTIRQMEADRLLCAVSLPGQPDRYELAEVAEHHHHHFHCDACDRVFDIDGCVGGLSKLVPSGFEISGHSLTLSGTCADCAPGEPAFGGGA